MNNELLKLIIELVIIVAGFLAGRYVLPKYKTNVQSAVTQFEFILKYAESFCAYARQFLNSSGEEKMNDVVSKLKEICDQQGITVDENTLKAIAQKAYDSMVAAENKSKVIIETPTVENINDVIAIDESSETST